MQLLISSLFLLLITACGTSQKISTETTQRADLEGYETAYFASGCFWCVEAIYESVEGVPEVISGYAGGHTVNPTYRQVGSGTTGHAEVIEVYYDSEKIDFTTLVKIFYASQDPTTFGQSPDFGSAYRSIIFYKNQDEKTIAETAKKDIASQYKKPIVTEIIPFEVFYPAEDYHQNYEKLNPNQPYIKGVSIPRLKRFQKKHPELLKKK